MQGETKAQYYAKIDSLERQMCLLHQVMDEDREILAALALNHPWPKQEKKDGRR